MASMVEVNSDDEYAADDHEDDESLKAKLSGTLGVKPEVDSEGYPGVAKRPIATPARALEPCVKRQRKIPTRQERLLIASKARISRMCAPKSRRKELEVPDFVRQHWLSNKEEMGRLLLDLNFDKGKFISQLEVIISKKQKYTIIVDQGWFSKDELRLADVFGSLLRKRVLAAIKYCESQPDTHVRQNLYDNEKEFWAKEDGPVMPENCFLGLEKMKNRALADEKKSLEEKPMDDKFTRVKKTRALVKELQNDYDPNNADVKKQDIRSLDDLYDKGQELVIGSGLQGGWNEECSRATATEQKIRLLVPKLIFSSEEDIRKALLRQAKIAAESPPEIEAQPEEGPMAGELQIRCSSVVAQQMSYQVSSLAKLSEGWQVQSAMESGPESEGHEHQRFSNRATFEHTRTRKLKGLFPGPRDQPKQQSPRIAQNVAVPLSMLGEEDLAFPILKLRDWGQFLADKHCLHLLVGLTKPDLKREQDICEEFWAKFKKLQPDHQIYERFAQHSMDPKLTFPFVYHGDEGRGRRRSPFLVGNFHSLLGKGTQVYFAVIAVTGDWPWLHRSGCLARSFNNIPKKTGDKMTGICHRCAAGTEGIPWEVIHERSPLWLDTTFSVSGFAKVPAVARLLGVPGQEEGLLRFDFFHAFHLGVGKHFLGSSLALWSTHFPGGNVDLRVEALEAAFFSWCRANKEVPVITRLTKETLQWPSTLDFPAASWFKGGVTTVMFKFLAATMCQQNWAHEPMLEKAAEAVVSMNKCLSALYASDMFIEPGRAAQIAEDGLRFLRRLAWLAKQAAKEQRALWLLTPKTHVIHHLLLEDLLLPARQGIWPMNPLSWSVQMDEDFVGFSSRLARRVDPRTCSKRCIERYLYAAYAQYVKAKYIIPRS
ncbi:unnamed protein product [Symbiodinium sp. CCMP2456]|nr:unnamed protein product [Symbiodinium sp. CCMP2456]